MNSLLYKVGLKFRDSSLESAYKNAQTQDSKIFFFISSAIAFSLLLLHTILEIMNSRDHLILKGVLLLCSFLALCLKRKIGKAYRYCFAIITLCFLGFVEIKHSFYIHRDLSYYLHGNIIGYLEVIFVLGFQSLIVKIFLVCVLFTFKIVMIYNQIIEEKIVLIITTYCLLLVIFILHDVFTRQGFARAHTQQQKLNGFEELLAEGLPTSLIMVSSDSTELIFSNKFFNQNFEKLNNSSEKSISNFLKDFIIEDMRKSASCSDCLNLADFICHLQKDSTMISCESQYFTIMVSFMSSNGILSNYEVKIAKIFWESKLCYSIIFEEVSNKQLAMALKLADEQKDRVIATLTHELKTPINGIMGILEILRSLINDNKVALDYISYCKNCANLLLYLVNSTLDLSWARQGKLKISKSNFLIDDLMTEAKSLFSFQSQQKNLNFELEKGVGIPNKIYSDKNRLIGILVNLLSNAFKFTFRGSVKLYISVDNSDSSKLRFSVIDTGIGIKKEDTSRLFAMFGKIDENNSSVNSHGAGLGLTIANTLARELDHSNKGTAIEIQSEIGNGSTFSFTISYKNTHFTNSPLLVSNPELYKNTTEEVDFQELAMGELSPSRKMKSFSTHIIHSPQLVMNSERDILHHFSTKWSDVQLTRFASQVYYKKNVLLVDDNPFNLLTASFILEKNGMIVTKAKGGEECLELLENSMKEHKPYDLILMDIQMPVLNGIETSRIISQKIKENKLYKVSIVALTANPRTEKDLREYKENGILDALEKPLKEEDIHSILNLYFSG